MSLFLSPYIGAGTKSDAFRPRGADIPEASAIDIRLDCTKVDGGGVGFALVWVASGQPSPIGAIKLADDYGETVSALIRNQVSNRLGVDVSRDATIQDVVETVMLRPDVSGVTTWKQLRPSNARYECWLGSGSGKRRWVDLPVIAGGAISDTFTRSNETPLASPWTNVNGSTCTLASNTLVKTAGFDESIYYYSHGAGWNADQTAEFSYVTAISNDDWGPAVRVASSAATAYFFGLYSAAPSIYKVVAGTTTLVQSLTVTGTTGNTYKIGVVGSTIRAYENGIEVTGSPGTDSSITGAGGGAGFYYYYPNGALDNFSATGEITAGTSTPKLMLMGVGGIRIAAAAQLKNPMTRRGFFKTLGALCLPGK